MNAEAAKELALRVRPELRATVDESFERVLRLIEGAAMTGVLGLSWNNGGNLRINPEMPGGFMPSKRILKKLEALGYTVEEREYPDSGIRVVDVEWT